MIMFMQKVLDYFARREDMRKLKKWRKGKMYLTKTTEGQMIVYNPKMFTPVSKMLIEERLKQCPNQTMKLSDGSTVQLTDPKKMKGTLEVSL